METFSVSEIINEISNYYCWEQNVEIDVEDKKRWAREQYQFLMEHILLQDMKKFKENPQVRNSHNLIPVNDVPLVAAILLRAVSKKPEDELIASWFNGNISDNSANDENQYKKVLELCSDIDEMFIKMRTDDDYFSGFELNANLKPTEYDCKRWSTAIKSSLNYEAAFGRDEFQKKLDEICKQILPLKHTLLVGEDDGVFAGIAPAIRKMQLEGRIDYIEEDEENTRHIDDTSKEKQAVLRQLHNCGLQKTNLNNVKNKTLPELLQSCYIQADYINLIMELLNFISDDINVKLANEICRYVNEKQEKGLKNVSELFSEESIAQDDLRKFQSICEFLKNDPETLEILEQKFSESGLLDYFCVEKPKEKQKNNKKK